MQTELDRTSYTLSGRKVSANFVDATTIDYLRRKTKKHILEKHPEILDTLKQMGQNIEENENLSSWIRYVNEDLNNTLPPSVVLFDFETQLLKAEGNASLGDALVRAIWEDPPNLLLIKAILSSHPNSDLIKGSGGHYSLSKALAGAALKANCHKIVKALFSHKNAKDIGHTGLFGLTTAIRYAIDKKNLPIVLEILMHPKTPKIPEEGYYGYKACTACAKEKGATEIHELLQRTFGVYDHAQPSSAEFKMKKESELNEEEKAGDALIQAVWQTPPDLQRIEECLLVNLRATGHYGLGKALIGAIFRTKSIETTKCPKIVADILSHKNASNIPAAGIFSLSTAIKYAIESDNPTIVEAILTLPNAKEIPPDGAYGYNSLLSFAKAKNADEIRQLLKLVFLKNKEEKKKESLGCA